MAASLGLGLLWIVATGLIARHDEDAVRAELGTLRSDLTHGDESGAASLAARMQDQASTARARTTGPAWWLATQLPLVGRPAHTVRGITDLVDQLARSTLPPVLEAGNLLDPSQLRKPSAQVDPRRLAEAAVPLGLAVRSTDSIASRAQQLPRSTWLHSVDTSRNSLVTQLVKLRRGLADLATAARVLPGPLGETGTRRYFLAFETDAESRGLGGLPGAYAILQARHGELSFLRFGSDADLSGAHAHVALGVDFDREFDATFGPEAYFGNSDASPNFPYAARIWMSMWEDKFHQHLDGAIATDPTALSYLLGAIGPVRLSDGTTLDRSNAVTFFENGVYAKFASDNAARKRYQVASSRAVAHAVLGQPTGDLFSSAKALQQAADQGRLLLYSSDPAVESSLLQEPVGGTLPETTRPFLDVVLNNGTGNKMDYYLDRTVTYTRKSCNSSRATVTITLHSGAPASGLPPYVEGPYGVAHPRLAGHYDLIVSVYDTDHSLVTRETLDGKTGYFAIEHERGHPVAITDVPIGPGQTRTVILYLHEPPATAPLLALRQPLVRPLVQTISMPNCR